MSGRRLGHRGWHGGSGMEIGQADAAEASIGMVLGCLRMA
jgi:hypothetical protein